MTTIEDQLIECVEKGNIILAQKILEEQERVNLGVLTLPMRYAFFMHSMKTQMDFVHLFLRYGYDLTNNNYKLLEAAAVSEPDENGVPRLLPILAGAGVDLVKSDHLIALQALFVEYTAQDIRENSIPFYYILEHGAALNELSISTISPIIRSLILRDKMDCLQLLVENGLPEDRCLRAICELRTPERINNNIHWDEKVKQKFSHMAGRFQAYFERRAILPQENALPSQMEHKKRI